MKIFWLIIILFLLNGYAIGKGVQLYPKPKEVSFTEKEIKLPEKIKIWTNASSKLNTGIEYLVEEFSKNRKVFINGSGLDANLLISLDKNFTLKNVDSSLIDEAYWINISNSGIKIKGRTERGLYYGIISLIGLVKNNSKIFVTDIADWPDVKIRGISDDISRGQVSTVDNFKKIIKNISFYKMNTYMPYIEDMLKFDKYPEIGLNRGALTKEEVKEIVNYADKHYVDVIPIFQTLGHYENILSDEKFLKYADFPGAASLDLTNNEIYPFLEDLLKEVFEIFPSDIIHIGADESFDVGKGNSREAVEKSSLAEVHLSHYKKVYEICKKYGKEVWMYGDIILRHPEILEGLPKDITIVDWHYGVDKHYYSTDILKNYGLSFISSPSVWNFVTPFPKNFVAIGNAKRFICDGIDNGTVGMINSNWGDYGAETFKELLYLTYGYSAALAWNHNDADYNDYEKYFFKDYFGTDGELFSDIFYLLGNETAQISWHELWRHPGLDDRNKRWWELNLKDTFVEDFLNITAKKIDDKLKEAYNKAKFNKDNLKILSFVNDLIKLYANKVNLEFDLDLIRSIEEREKELNKLDDVEKIKLNADKKRVDFKKSVLKCDNLIKELKDLKENFKTIWLTYYKEANLWMIEDKFERLVAYIEEIRNDLNDGRLGDYYLSSKWIYGKNGRQKSDETDFVKEFMLPGFFDKAYIQLIADSYAELYINGNYVDKVFVRPSLSLYTEYKRVLFLDAKKYFKPGKNTIEIKAKNFETRGKAGINFIAFIKQNENIITLETDESWKSFDGKKRLKTYIDKYKYDITRPDFEKLRKSWIER